VTQGTDQQAPASTDQQEPRSMDRQDPGTAAPQINALQTNVTKINTRHKTEHPCDASRSPARSLRPGRLQRPDRRHRHPSIVVDL